MFDAHIQYYCYDNKENDEFGVGYLGDKDFWVRLINTWRRNDGINNKLTVDQWDMIPGPDGTFPKGCMLAEVVTVDDGYEVYVVIGEGPAAIDYKYKITNDFKIVDLFDGHLKDLNGKSPSVPRWVTRLKKQLKSQEN